jgi:hypothetical protein
MFDSDPEEDQDFTVVGIRTEALSTTVQPPDDVIISETELESDDEVAIVSFRPAAGPSVSMMALPHDDTVVSETEPESDEEDTVSLTHMIYLELTLIANRQSSWTWVRGLGSNVSSSWSDFVSLDVVHR